MKENGSTTNEYIIKETTEPLTINKVGHLMGYLRTTDGQQNMAKLQLQPLDRSVAFDMIDLMDEIPEGQTAERLQYDAFLSLNQFFNSTTEEQEAWREKEVGKLSERGKSAVTAILEVFEKIHAEEKYWSLVAYYLDFNKEKFHQKPGVRKNH